MTLPSKDDEEIRLLRENKASTITVRYRLWHSYKEAINVVDIQQDPDAEIVAALKVIEDIQKWHPEWMTSYIDFDLDMYTACGRQSKIVVNAMQAYQQNNNSDTAEQYKLALEDFRMLSQVAGDVNSNNYVGKWLLGLSAVMLVGLYIIFPTVLFSALIDSLFIIPIVLLIALSLILTGEASFLYAPAMFSLLNITVFVSVSIGIVGLLLFLPNPSPQGSVKLAQAMDNLISACEQHCPLPAEIPEQGLDLAQASDSLMRACELHCLLPAEIPEQVLKVAQAADNLLSAFKT